MASLERRATTLSVGLYTGISLTLAALFFVVTSISGKYPDVARYGGTAWVFLLSMIITMPTVTPMVKKRLKR